MMKRRSFLKAIGLLLAPLVGGAHKVRRVAGVAGQPHNQDQWAECIHDQQDGIIETGGGDLQHAVVPGTEALYEIECAEYLEPGDMASCNSEGRLVKYASERNDLLLGIVHTATDRMTRRSRVWVGSYCSAGIEGNGGQERCQC